MHGRILHPMDTQRRDGQPRWCLPWRLAAVIALGLTLANSSAVQAKTFHCGAGDVACLIAAINEPMPMAKRTRFAWRRAPIP